MDQKTKDEFMHLFGVSLAIVATATLVILSRSASITGYATFDASSTSSLFIVGILILAGLAVVLGAIIVIYKLKKESESHKKAIGENKTQIVDSPDAELMRYVMKAKEQGFNDKQIVERLKKLDWLEKDILRHLEPKELKEPTSI